jgi:hypothetical protein
MGYTPGQLTPVRPDEPDVVGASGSMPLTSTNAMCTRFLVGIAEKSSDLYHHSKWSATRSGEPPRRAGSLVQDARRRKNRFV